MTDNIHHYAQLHTTPESALAQEIAEYTRAHVPNAQMLCGRVEGQLLNFLVHSIQAKNILELGTFTGYSALLMAEALPEDGLLVSCDKNIEVLTIAQEFLKRSPHAYKIQLVHKEAMVLVDELLAQQKKFDFCFIDANKKPNAEYIEKCLQMLTPQGIIVLDNTLYHEEVLDPQEAVGKIIAKLNDNLAKRHDLQVILLPVRDGITLIRKK